MEERAHGQKQIHGYYHFYGIVKYKENAARHLTTLLSSVTFVSTESPNQCSEQ